MTNLRNRNSRGLNGIMENFFLDELKRNADKIITNVSIWVISSNPKRWVGHYGYIGHTYGNVHRHVDMICSKSDLRFLNRVLSSIENHHIVERYYYSEDYSKNEYRENVFVFVGDWINKEDGLYYSKNLDNFYYTGEEWEHPCWYSPFYTPHIQSYIKNMEFTNYGFGSYMEDIGEDDQKYEETIELKHKLINYEVIVDDTEELNPYVDPSKAYNGGGYHQPRYTGRVINIDDDREVYNFTYSDTSCGDFGSRHSVLVNGKEYSKYAVFGSMDGLEESSDFQDSSEVDMNIRRVLEKEFGIMIPTACGNIIIFD